MLQVNLQAHIVFVFVPPRKKCTVLPLQNVEGPVLYEFIPASDVHGQEKEGLAFRRGEMEADAIVVYKLDIER